MPGNTFHLNDIHAAQQNFQLKIKSAVIPDFIVVLTQVRSLPCLVRLWHCWILLTLLNLSKLSYVLLAKQNQFEDWPRFQSFWSIVSLVMFFSISGGFSVLNRPKFCDEKDICLLIIVRRHALRVVGRGWVVLRPVPLQDTRVTLHLVVVILSMVIRLEGAAF